MNNTRMTLDDVKAFLAMIVGMMIWYWVVCHV